MGISELLGALQMLIFVMIIALTLICSVPLLIIRRFRHYFNVYSLNICLSTLICSLFWIYIYIISKVDILQLYYSPVCALISYLQVALTICIPYSLVIISIHRYCLIVHHRHRYLQSAQWIVICFLSQWLIGFVLASPMMTKKTPVRRCSFLMNRRFSQWNSRLVIRRNGWNITR